MSSVQFFTPAALTRAESASRPTPAEQQRLWGRFVARLAQAEIAADLYGTPHCPLRPDQTALHGGGSFAATWLLVRFDSLSPTQVSAVTVTSLESGRSETFGQVIRKERRNRTTGAASVRYHSPAGSHGTREEVAAALVEMAAARLTRPPQPRPCPCTDGDRQQALFGCPSCCGTGRVG